MSNIAYELFASRLKESMNQQQMKPIDLLHLAEEQNLKLGKSHISQYVNGKTMPRAEILQFLADALQVDADWLAGRTGSAQDFSSEKLNSGGTKLSSEFNFCPNPDTVNGSSAAGSVQSSAFSKRSDSVQKKSSSRQDGSDFSAPSASQPTLFKKSSKLNNVLYDVRGPVVDEAERMESSGVQILKLNIGNPAPFGFRTPDEVIYDMRQQLTECEGYSPAKGLFAARKAIMQYAQLKNIPNVTIEDIYTGNGVSELINLSMSALLDDGDEILIPSPDYPLWTACATLAGGKAVHYLCDEQADWYPDLADIRKKITRHTKAIVIINPNNPTGALYPKEVLEGIVEIARQHHLIIFSDEIYDRLVMDGGEHISIASLAPDLFCVTFSGLSKSHMIAGFRIGWMILSGNKAIAQDYIEGIRMLSNMRLCSNVPAQSIVQTALGGYQSVSNYLTPGGRIYEQRECIYQALKDIPGLSVVKPKAAFYMFPKLDVKKFHITKECRISGKVKCQTIIEGQYKSARNTACHTTAVDGLHHFHFTERRRKSPPKVHGLEIDYGFRKKSDDFRNSDDFCTCPFRNGNSISKMIRMGMGKKNIVTFYFAGSFFGKSIPGEERIKKQFFLSCVNLEARMSQKYKFHFHHSFDRI